jgi:hypothetical protein
VPHNQRVTISVEGVTHESLTFTYAGRKVTGAYLDRKAIATLTYDGHFISGIFTGKAKDKGTLRILPNT